MGFIRLMRQLVITEIQLVELHLNSSDKKLHKIKISESVKQKKM